MPCSSWFCCSKIILSLGNTLEFCGYLHFRQQKWRPQPLAFVEEFDITGTPQKEPRPKLARCCQAIRAWVAALVIGFVFFVLSNPAFWLPLVAVLQSIEKSIENGNIWKQRLATLESFALQVSQGDGVVIQTTSWDEREVEGRKWKWNVVLVTIQLFCLERGRGRERLFVVLFIDLFLHAFTLI